MTKSEGRINDETPMANGFSIAAPRDVARPFDPSGFVIVSEFGFRHSGLAIDPPTNVTCARTLVVKKISRWIAFLRCKIL